MIPADMILDTASPRQAQACDGVVDFGDIDPFVLALSGQAACDAVYPDCNWLNGDVDDDSDVDYDDLDLFVSPGRRERLSPRVYVGRRESVDQRRSVRPVMRRPTTSRSSSRMITSVGECRRRFRRTPARRARSRRS